jgi:hypothetical protein
MHLHLHQSFNMGRPSSKSHDTVKEERSGLPGGGGGGEIMLRWSPLSGVAQRSVEYSLHFLANSRVEIVSAGRKMLSSCE